MIEKLLATLLMWLFGLPIYLPWVLARLGFYKRWYFAPFIPPFSWRGWIQVWPGSAFFVCFPFIALLPLSDDVFMKVSNGIGIAGFVLAFIFVLWTPRWAKPGWQRRLEDRYRFEEISDFIQAWKEMDFKEWAELIETEEGMKQLVERAGGAYRPAPRSSS